MNSADFSDDGKKVENEIENLVATVLQNSHIHEFHRNFAIIRFHCKTPPLQPY